MPESRLAVAYNDLVGEVGVYFGYGRGPVFGDPAWAVQQKQVIDSCVKSGLRQFYVPPPIEGSTSSYDWSFLKPVVSMDFPTGKGVVLLPDDFGGFEGELTCGNSSTTVCWPIPLVEDGLIRQRYAVEPSATGWPGRAARARDDPWPSAAPNVGG